MTNNKFIKKNMKFILLISLVFVMVSPLGLATEMADEAIFENARAIIQNKTSCTVLTNAQLEIVGDYIMEQMHPQELHEIMDSRLGGEGSEQLRQVHISLAKTFYCGERNVMSLGMMNTMMGRTGGYGMMKYYPAIDSTINNYYPYYLWVIISLLVTIIVILIILLTIKRYSNKTKNHWRKHE